MSGTTAPRLLTHTCSKADGGSPYVKGFTIMVNSIYNGWCMEDAWLDK